MTKEWKDWETAFDRDGVKLETRKNAKSGVLQTRVTGTVAAPTDDVWKEIVTPESYCALLPKTLESRYIDEKPKQKQVYCYQRVSGGPVSERDYTLKVTWTEEKAKHGKKYHRAWTIENDKGPEPRKGVVRVEVHDGSWTLTPADKGKTAFEQVNYIELGGSLWTMLANQAVQDAAKELVVNLKRRFEA